MQAHPGGATCLQFLHDGRLVSGGRNHTVKLWGSGGNQIRQFEPFGELVMKVAATHDGGRIVAGDWSGEVRLASVADGKLVSRLAANPPTLEMLLPKRQAEAAARRTLAERTARDADAARKAFDEKRRAAKLAAKRPPSPARPPRTSPRKKRPLRRRSNEFGVREFIPAFYFLFLEWGRDTMLLGRAFFIAAECGCIRGDVQCVQVLLKRAAIETTAADVFCRSPLEIVATVAWASLRVPPKGLSII